MVATFVEICRNICNVNDGIEKKTEKAC